jgi:2-polyprenyl-3-methyl-5-hydroxy-6-metoxy-1,4-benzoquinol methylase
MEGQRRPSALSVSDFQRLLLLPGHASLAESFCSELCEFTGIEPSVALARMKTSTQTMAKNWESRERSTEQSQKDFYLNNEEYLFELSNYNSTDHFGGLCVAATNLALSKTNVKTVLDFGCGIGSLSIVLARLGFDVILTDISKPLLAFASWRFKRRGLRGRFFNLESEEPAGSTADLVVAFDTLEHIGDPRNALERVYQWLTPEGFIVFNTFSPEEIRRDREHPMHVSSGRKILPEMRSIGFGRRRILQGIACYQKPARQLIPRWIQAVLSRAYWSTRWTLRDLLK